MVISIENNVWIDSCDYNIVLFIVLFQVSDVMFLSCYVVLCIKERLWEVRYYGMCFKE